MYTFAWICMYSLPETKIIQDIWQALYIGHDAKANRLNYETQLCTKSENITLILH